ncbi:hypothetical protein, partial [Fangia hongkongensis]|uniref:hypothetical protein n=1 Tax=Fangia hongkongensis TaxID=270495 RepID=UPI001F23C67F
MSLNLPPFSRALFEGAYRILRKDNFEQFAQYFKDADFDVKAERWRDFEDNLVVFYFVFYMFLPHST